MIVARRFIAGFGTTWGLRPGGTPEYRRGIVLGESELHGLSRPKKGQENNDHYVQFQNLPRTLCN